MKTRVSAKKTVSAPKKPRVYIIESARVANVTAVIKLKKPRVYIAGKVTGEPVITCNKKFEDKEKDLVAKGYEVVNPIKVVNDNKCDWAAAMRKCLAAMLTCDFIYCLPCWANSRGARLERFIAPLVGIKIMETEN